MSVQGAGYCFFRYTRVFNLICVRFGFCARPINCKIQMETGQIVFALHFNVIFVSPACRNQSLSLPPQHPSTWIQFPLEHPVLGSSSEYLVTPCQCTSLEHLKANCRCNKVLFRARRKQLRCSFPTTFAAFLRHVAGMLRRRSSLCTFN